MVKAKKGQSTLEYIIVFTAIIGAVLLVANTVVKEKATNIMTHAAEQAEAAANHLTFE